MFVYKTFQQYGLKTEWLEHAQYRVYSKSIFILKV